MNLISPHILFFGLLAVCRLLRVQAAPIAPHSQYHPGVAQHVSSNYTLLKRARTVEAKLYVLRFHSKAENPVFEHWALLLEPTHPNLNAAFVEGVTEKDPVLDLQSYLSTPLKGKRKDFQTIPGQDCVRTYIGVANLDVEAKTKAWSSFLETLRKVPNLQVPPMNVGGNCIDYVEAILKHFVQNKVSDSKVLGAFRVLKDSQYARVRENTWGKYINLWKAQQAGGK